MHIFCMCILLLDSPQNGIIDIAISFSSHIAISPALAFM